MYGQDIYYLPRDIINEDQVLNEVTSRFNSSYKVEMYIENIEGFDGEGDLFTKFGVEIRDQATFVIARRRWDQTVKRYDNEISSVRPFEGDLLYIPFSKKIFEITHVEHEQPFYQLQNLPTYKLRCELFEYSSEEFDTNVAEIDQVESLNFKNTESFIQLTDSSENNFVVGNQVYQVLNSGVTIRAEIQSYNDSSQQLGISHIRADDNKYHEFGNGVIKSADINGNIITRGVSFNLDAVPSPTNRYYKNLADFLDFSESNPFGDVS